MYSRGNSPRKDHSPDYFFPVNNNNTFYSKNKESAAIDNQTSQYRRNPQQTYSPPGKLLMSNMQNRYFHHSNIFDGVQQPKQYVERELEKQKDNQLEQLRVSKGNGAITNKNYNITTNQHQLKLGGHSPAKQITLEFDTENSNVDQAELKKQLLRQGVQVGEIQMKNPLNIGANKNQGSITVRGLEDNISNATKVLNKFGIRTQEKNQQYQLSHQNRTWMQQSQQYDRIKYFNKSKQGNTKPK